MSSRCSKSARSLAPDVYAAAVRCELFLPTVQSLKEKRRVLKPLVEGLRRKFAVSVAEVDHANAWQRSAVAVAVVTSHPDLLQDLIIAVRDFIDAADELELVAYDVTHVEAT